MKRYQYQEFLDRLALKPYKSAIENLTIMADMELTRSPFDMVTCIANISKDIEREITEFWRGIDIINPEKLIIDGDNILMLYLYIILEAKIPKLFAYIKMMDEFSTTYVRSISRFGYCLSTLEIAMERITCNSLTELISSQNNQNLDHRSREFVKNLKESVLTARERAGSLHVDNNLVFSDTGDAKIHRGHSSIHQQVSMKSNEHQVDENLNESLRMQNQKPNVFAKYFKKSTVMLLDEDFKPNANHRSKSVWSQSSTSKHRVQGETSSR